MEKAWWHLCNREVCTSPVSNCDVLITDFYCVIHFSGLPLRPNYTNLCVDGKVYTVIYIASNYHAVDINMWKNEEYICCAKEVAFTDEETMGQLC